MELDETTGLYEMDLRRYDPAIARFTAIDPVVHHSMSPYNAFDGNPVFWADPSGANAVITHGGDGVLLTGQDAIDAFKIIKKNIGGGPGDKEKKKKRVGERERREDTNYTASDEELEDFEQRYRDIVQYGRDNDYNTAADLLEHFLDGSGSEYEVDSQWLLGFSVVSRAQRTNLLRFAAQALAKFRSLKDGESSTFSDYWDRSITGGIFTELYYASGTSTLTSTGTFTVTNRGGRVYISGSIKHQWSDPYDWHAGLGVILPGFGLVSDEEAQLLQYSGRAKEFNMKSSWNQNVNWKGLGSVPQH